MTLSKAQADDIIKKLSLMKRAQVAEKVELHRWKLKYVLRNNPGKAVGDWYATSPAGQQFRAWKPLKEHIIAFECPSRWASESGGEPARLAGRPPSPVGDGTSEWATGAMQPDGPGRRSALIALLTSLPPLPDWAIGRLEHAISPWVEEAKARHLGLTKVEQRQSGKPQKVKILDPELDSSRGAAAARWRRLLAVGLQVCVSMHTVRVVRLQIRLAWPLLGLANAVRDHGFYLLSGRFIAQWIMLADAGLLQQQAVIVFEVLHLGVI